MPEQRKTGYHQHNGSVQSSAAVRALRDARTGATVAPMTVHVIMADPCVIAQQQVRRIPTTKPSTTHRPHAVTGKGSPIVTQKVLREGILDRLGESADMREHDPR